MKGMQTHMEKLLADAEECALIGKLATDAQKRELFARLAAHLRVLAGEVERAIAAKRRHSRSTGDYPVIQRITRHLGASLVGGTSALTRS
jgi:hypothetical protein